MLTRAAMWLTKQFIAEAVQVPTDALRAAAFALPTAPTGIHRFMREAARMEVPSQRRFGKSSAVSAFHSPTPETRPKHERTPEAVRENLPICVIE
jgi:hypothetical protein